MKERQITEEGKIFVDNLVLKHRPSLEPLLQLIAIIFVYFAFGVFWFIVGVVAVIVSAIMNIDKSRLEREELRNAYYSALLNGATTRQVTNATKPLRFWTIWNLRRMTNG